jgi:hypothetical protein
MVLEAFFNGASGITYFLAENFDSPEDFRAHARAVALLERYEDFFTSGTVESFGGDYEEITYSARSLPGRRLILVGNYRSRRAETAEFQTGCQGPLRDGESGAELPTRDGLARLEVLANSSRVLECETRRP